MRVGAPLLTASLLLVLCTGRSAALCMSTATRIERARTDEQLRAAASAFANAFWGEQHTSLDASLARLHYADMEERYGELVGTRRLSSTLLLARDQVGAILGLAGCELAVVDMPKRSVLSRKRGEALFKEGLSAMGARQRNELRKAPLSELARALLPAGAQVMPVLSNLAVLPAGRRKGLGRMLCNEIEAVASGWIDAGAESTQLLLQVEAQNSPARSLYNSLGFSELWTNENAAASQIVDGELITGTTTLITMGKELGKN